MILVQWNNIHACPPPTFIDLLQHLQISFQQKLLHHVVSQEICSSLTKKHYNLLDISKGVPPFFIYFFWGWIMATLVTKKNQVRLIIPTRIFVKRKSAKVARFWGICFSGIAIFRQLLPSGGFNRVLRKVTLFLGLLSTPIPSFAGRSAK